MGFVLGLQAQTAAVGTGPEHAFGAAQSGSPVSTISMSGCLGSTLSAAGCGPLSTVSAVICA